MKETPLPQQHNRITKVTNSLVRTEYKNWHHPQHTNLCQKGLPTTSSSYHFTLKPTYSPSFSKSKYCRTTLVSVMSYFLPCLFTTSCHRDQDGCCHMPHLSVSGCGVITAQEQQLTVDLYQ